jgi:serine/threonine-protein kinase
LTELRDKAARGDSIAMVWPSAQTGGGGKPSRASLTPTADRPRKKPRKSGSISAMAASAITGRARSAESLESVRWNRALLETGGLILALVVIAGVIVYLSWPYSQSELYRKAEALMSSSKRSDWVTARDEYLEKLDERFPDHPYREQTRKWRDKIALEDAERRAGFLNGPLPTEPANTAERAFKIANAVAVEATRRNDDLGALEQWRKLAEVLKTDDPDDRGWHLLALRRAEGLDNAIKDRRQIVLKLMDDAEVAFRAGRTKEATAIKNKLIDDYSRYTDLSDLFPPPPANTPGTPATGAGTSRHPETSSPSPPLPPTTPESLPPAAPAPTPSKASAELPAKSKPKTPSSEP